MRIMTPADVGRVYGAFWEKAWKQPGLVEGLSQAASGALTYLGTLAAQVEDYAAPDTVPLLDTRDWTLLQFDDRDVKREMVKIGDSTVGYFAVDQLAEPFAWSIPCPFESAALITDSPHKPDMVLAQGSDFTITDGRVVFSQDPAAMAIRRSPIMYSDDAAGLRGSLWLCRSCAATNNLYKYFGSLIGMSAPSTEEARRVLVAAWRLLVEGPNDLRVNQMLAALAGFDVPQAAGTVIAVWDEAGRRCVRVDDSVHSAVIPADDASWDATVAEGDAVIPGQLLFNSVSVVEDLDSDDAPDAMRLSQGMVDPLDGILLENKLTALDFEMLPANPAYTVVWDEASHVLTMTGEDYSASVFSPSFETLLDMGVAKVPRFAAGDPGMALEWRQRMAVQSVSLGVDLWAWATTGLVPPYQVNPLKLILGAGVGGSITMVSFKESCAIERRMLDLGFKWLARCMPAGSLVLLLLRAEGDEDACDPSDEQSSVFYAPETVVESADPSNGRMASASNIY